MNRPPVIFALISIVVLLALILNCSEDPSLPVDSAGRVLDLPSGPLVVERISRDEHTRVISATLLSGSVARQLTIEPVAEGPLVDGLTAELTDVTGLLYRVSIAWDPDDPDRIWFREQTTTDVMTVSAGSSGDRVFEEYDTNGDVYRVDVPALDDETRRRVIGHSRSGWQPEDPEHVELVGSYADFEVYYNRHANNSLHDNPDGEVLVETLLNEQFAALAVGAAVQPVDGKDNEQPGKISDRARKICVGAGICARFKCMAGGWVNPLCVACGGTSIACTFATVACWFADCD